MYWVGDRQRRSSKRGNDEAFRSGADCARFFYWRHHLLRNCSAALLGRSASRTLHLCNDEHHKWREVVVVVFVQKLKNLFLFTELFQFSSSTRAASIIFA